MRARAHTPGPSTSCPCSEETPHRFAGEDALQELPEEVSACPQHRKQETQKSAVPPPGGGRPRRAMPMLGGVCSPASCSVLATCKDRSSQLGCPPGMPCVGTESGASASQVCHAPRGPHTPPVPGTACEHPFPARAPTHILCPANVLHMTPSLGCTLASLQSRVPLS